MRDGPSARVYFGSIPSRLRSNESMPIHPPAALKAVDQRASKAGLRTIATGRNGLRWFREPWLPWAILSVNVANVAYVAYIRTTAWLPKQETRDFSFT